MDTIELKQLTPRHFIGLRRKVPVTELAAFFSEALPKAHRWVAARGITPDSMPMAHWVSMDMKSGIADCHAGCFVAEETAGEGEITAGVTPGGDALVATHTGPYDTVGKTWQAVYARAAELGRAPGSGWEIYLNDPTETPPEALQTRIHLPVGDLPGASAKEPYQGE